MSKAATDTLDKVSSEFQGEVLADLDQGRTESMARIEAARRETAEAVAKVLESSVKQAESLKRQIVGAAELQARNAQLKVLEKAVNEVFEMATKEISESEGSSYEAAIVRLIKEGIDVIGPKARVSCSSKDKKAVSAAIKKLNSSSVKLSLEEEHIETIGGVVLSNTDGTVRFDNTFEARLERTKPTLRKEVAGVLTGSG
ncbi:MAG TPA: V-type ATP synthase subunit E family protein [Nitrososphaerales archaeon]|nr:V-type ATP synthase subunit E family protein [Nitrososphaerales archaeon]